MFNGVVTPLSVIRNPFFHSKTLRYKFTSNSRDSKIISTQQNILCSVGSRENYILPIRHICFVVVVMMKILRGLELQST